VVVTVLKPLAQRNLARPILAAAVAAEAGILIVLAAQAAAALSLSNT
jgi:hypothetical protein